MCSGSISSLIIEVNNLIFLKPYDIDKRILHNNIKQMQYSLHTLTSPSMNSMPKPYMVGIQFLSQVAQDHDEKNKHRYTACIKELESAYNFKGDKRYRIQFTHQLKHNKQIETSYLETLLALCICD